MRIRARAATEAEAKQQVESARSVIYQRLPNYIFGEGEECELQHAVASGLQNRNESIATVELGNAAPLGQLFAELELPQVCRGGLSFRDTSALSRFFGQTGGVTVAESLSEIGSRFNADWVLAVDGYPRIVDAARGGVLAIDLWVFHRSWQQPKRRELHLGGHPDILHARIAKTALDWLRKGLLDQWT